MAVIVSEILPDETTRRYEIDVEVEITDSSVVEEETSQTADDSVQVDTVKQEVFEPTFEPKYLSKYDLSVGQQT